MKRTEQKAQWQELNDQVFEEVLQWRETHPHATMREIEKELDDRIFELRAKMLADTAEGSGEVPREDVKCPDCGARMMRKGKKKRTLLQREGQELELEQEYLVCLECGRGLFPPGGGTWITAGETDAAGSGVSGEAGGWMPFEKAAEMLGEMVGIRVCKIVAQNYAEAAGAAYVQMQEEEVGELEREMPEVQGEGVEKMQISADGATPHLRWVQVWYHYCMGSGQRSGRWWWEKYAAGSRRMENERCIPAI